MRESRQGRVNLDEETREVEGRGPRITIRDLRLRDPEERRNRSRGAAEGDTFGLGWIEKTNPRSGWRIPDWTISRSACGLGASAFTDP